MTDQVKRQLSFLFVCQSLVFLGRIKFTICFNIIDAAKVSAPKKAKKFDIGFVPGDRRGAADIDSAFFFSSQAKLELD